MFGSESDHIPLQQLCCTCHESLDLVNDFSETRHQCVNSFLETGLFAYVSRVPFKSISPRSHVNEESDKTSTCDYLMSADGTHIIITHMHRSNTSKAFEFENLTPVFKGVWLSFQVCTYSPEYNTIAVCDLGMLLRGSIMVREIYPGRGEDDACNLVEVRGNGQSPFVGNGCPYPPVSVEVAS